MVNFSNLDTIIFIIFFIFCLIVLIFMMIKSKKLFTILKKINKQKNLFAFLKEFTMTNSVHIFSEAVITVFSISCFTIYYKTTTIHDIMPIKVFLHTLQYPVIIALLLGIIYGVCAVFATLIVLDKLLTNISDNEQKNIILKRHLLNYRLYTLFFAVLGSILYGVAGYIITKMLTIQNLIQTYGISEDFIIPLYFVSGFCWNAATWARLNRINWDYYIPEVGFREEKSFLFLIAQCFFTFISVSILAMITITSVTTATSTIESKDADVTSMYNIYFFIIFSLIGFYLKFIYKTNKKIDNEEGIYPSLERLLK